MKRLQICMLDSDFYLQQVRILHLDVKVENVQLQKSTSLNLKKRLLHEVNMQDGARCNKV